MVVPWGYSREGRGGPRGGGKVFLGEQRAGPRQWQCLLHQGAAEECWFAEIVYTFLLDL